jgi:hypothetical protein
MNKSKDIAQLKMDYQKWLKSRPHSRSAFPDSLRTAIFYFVEAGRSAEVCRVLGLPSSTVSNWRRRRDHVSIIEPGEQSNIETHEQRISYSRINLPGAPDQSQKAVLAEIELSSAGRRIAIRFHDQSCLERALPVLLRCGEQ